MKCYKTGLKNRVCFWLIGKLIRKCWKIHEQNWYGCSMWLSMGNIASKDRFKTIKNSLSLLTELLLEDLDRKGSGQKRICTEKDLYEVSCLQLTYCQCW